MIPLLMRNGLAGEPGTSISKSGTDEIAGKTGFAGVCSSRSKGVKLVSKEMKPVPLQRRDNFYFSKAYALAVKE